MDLGHPQAHRLIMKTPFTILLLLTACQMLLGSGAPSTYFNIYVPPNNEPIKRSVALIVTAIQDSTQFSIVDDAADGDEDDSVSGYLNAGQSYVLYIKDNGINDDARYASGGVHKQDGDYFTIKSDKLVYASMSTDSDWQHDFVASVNKRSVGVKFLVYAPKTSYSNRDLNVFAFEEGTTVTISRISQSTTLQTGYTDVDIAQKRIVAQRNIDPGQDLIYYYGDGRDIMEPGATYLIETNKEVSVQYGALRRNERDGGAYVPARNGSTAGELLYFSVPYQANGEQEIRVVSWDDDNEVLLERYQGGDWIAMDNWTLDALQPADWIGKQHGNTSYSTVFRVSCSAGKRVSVFEANWLETGSIGTSDIATMLSSANGTASGTEFLAYLPPPGKEENVLNPLTGQKFEHTFSHLFLFAGKQDATVTIKDAATNGQVINRSYTVAAGRYADAAFSSADWKSIYNGTGRPDGPERPYLTVSSDENISVMLTNFNDNWMMYFGSSLPHSFELGGSASQETGAPGDTLTARTDIEVGGDGNLQESSATIRVGSGAIPIESNFINDNTADTIPGRIDYLEKESIITYDSLPDLQDTEQYHFENKVIISAAYNDGTPIPPGTVVVVETIVRGKVDGERQESILAQGIENRTDDTGNLLFSNCSPNALTATDTESWNGAWIDVDEDGWEDLMVSNKHQEQRNQLFLNQRNGAIQQDNSGTLTSLRAPTVATVWGDINNDGRPDALIVNATQQRTTLYLNQGAGNFTPLLDSGIEIHPQYFHGAAFADFDNDGDLDLLITNFFQTRFHQLYRNNGDLSFSLLTDVSVSTVSARAMAPILADYDDDGLVDIFIPNGEDKPNSLFHNLGDFRFEQVSSGAIVTDAYNSVGANWGDYDGDDDLDLYVVNASGQDNNLYQNNGDGTFQRMDTLLITQEGGHSHSAQWIDADHDMDLDLLVANDEGPNFFYINEGADGFRRNLEEGIAANFGAVFGQAWADYDKDGDLDALFFTHEGKNQLFCGNASDRNYLNIKLVGTASNRSAIGATVRVKAGGNWQRRDLYPVTGFGSQNSMRLHFGLGDANSIDSIRVDWPSGNRMYISDGININSFITLIEVEGRVVQGRAFEDENSNQQYDAGEDWMGGIRVTLNPIGQRLSTNNQGQFHLRLNAGQYRAETAETAYWYPAEQDLTVPPGSDTLYLNLPLQAKQQGHDLTINAATTAWRRGFTNNTILQATNVGTQTVYNASIALDYPDGVYFLLADQSYTDAGNGSFRWQVDTLHPGQTVSINVIDSVGLEISTGDSLLLRSSVTANGFDLKPDNNLQEEYVPIVGAIDPNDMLVSPKGQGTEGYVKRRQWLTYTIRFQNVGTYYATHVRIANQLRAEHDRNSFEFISASHDHSYELSSEGKLLIHFDDIYLVDSTTNEPESHGFFKYRIRTRNGLPGGSCIENNAAITFDYEDPIITNTVVNTLQYESREVYDLQVFPNPATMESVITLEPEHIRFETPPLLHSYQVFNDRGQLVRSASEQQEPVLRIQLDGLSPGVYLIQATDQTGKLFATKLLLR